jgi:hypothetical protein
VLFLKLFDLSSCVIRLRLNLIKWPVAPVSEYKFVWLQAWQVFIVVDPTDKYLLLIINGN